jgi:hypothetical protein
MSGGSPFFVPQATATNGAVVNSSAPVKGARLHNLIAAQTTPSPAPTPPPPAVSQAPVVVSVTPSQQQQVAKAKTITVSVDVDHTWSAGQVANPKTKVGLKQALKKAGFDENTEVHIDQLRLTKFSNPTNVSLNAVHLGVSGEDTLASMNRFDASGDPVTAKLLPGNHYVPPEHQVVYSNPIRGTPDLIAKHSDVNVKKMREGLTLAPGTDQYVVWPGNNPKLYQMLLDNENKLEYGKVGGKAPHISVSQSSLDTFFVNYDKDVQSNFSRVVPDTLQVELRHPSEGAKFGEKIAAAQTHDSERDAFRNSKAKPTVSATYEYDVYPLGTTTANND